MRPPHYRKGSAARHCSNCGAYLNGWCSMFRLRVGAAMLCDRWYGRRR